MLARGGARRGRRDLPDGPTPGSGADSGPTADPESVARSIVLRKLTASPRTRAQLSADLAARDVPGDVAVRVLDRFTEVGLVDDAAFADLWVRSRLASKGLSRQVLRRELRAKGVDDELIAEAVEQVSPDDELSAARTLVAKRLPSTRRLTPEARQRRLVGLLARKGYPGGLALSVVRAALAADGDPEPAAGTGSAADG